MVWKQRAKVSAGNLVLSEGVPLPDGTEVLVQVEPVQPGVAAAGGDEEDFGAFFGMWADREEMTDSVAWVQRERDQWRQRLTRRD